MGINTTFAMLCEMKMVIFLQNQCLLNIRLTAVQRITQYP